MSSRSDSLQEPGLDWIRPGLIMIALAFLVQGVLVYSDFPRRGDRPSLSPDASGGLMLWRSYNCQVCHQIHGLGGFLGPDLTNITSRRTREELDDLLDRGRRQMPALHLEERERGQVIRFLEEVATSGRGLPPSPPVREGLEFTFLGEGAGKLPGAEPTKSQERGEALMGTLKCAACHRPFQTGRHGSPDLTLAVDRLTRPEIESQITRGTEWMPAFDFLTGDQVTDLVNYLEWLNHNRRTLGRAFLREPGSGPSPVELLPWFEY